MSEAHAHVYPIDATPEAPHGDAHHHHGPSLLLLTVIFAVLMFLTFVTVAVTEFDFGYTINLIVALAIAFLKAALVGIYFMHLRWDPPIFGFVLVLSLLFVTIFIGATLLDTSEYLPYLEQRAATEASR
jgi:cytochrome c oxidase subunit IV